jgi:hypothetical protein
MEHGAFAERSGHAANHEPQWYTSNAGTRTDPAKETGSARQTQKAKDECDDTVPEAS